MRCRRGDSSPVGLGTVRPQVAGRIGTSLPGARQRGLEDPMAGRSWGTPGKSVETDEPGPGKAGCYKNNATDRVKR